MPYVASTVMAMKQIRIRSSKAFMLAVQSLPVERAIEKMKIICSV